MSSETARPIETIVPRLWSVPALAAHFSFKKQTIYKRIRDKELPTVTILNTLRIRDEDARAWYDREVGKPQRSRGGNRRKR